MRVSPVFSFNHLKQLITFTCIHWLWEDRLDTDDQPVILVPGTTFSKAAIQHVSSNLLQCPDPITLQNGLLHIYNLFSQIFFFLSFWYAAKNEFLNLLWGDKGSGLMYGTYTLQLCEIWVLFISCHHVSSITDHQRPLPCLLGLWELLHNTSATQ